MEIPNLGGGRKFISIYGLLKLVRMAFKERLCIVSVLKEEVGSMVNHYFFILLLLLRSNPSRQHSKIYRWGIRRGKTGKHGKIGVK